MYSRGHKKVAVPKVWQKYAIIEPYFYHTVSVLSTENFLYAKYTMVSRRQLVASFLQSFFSLFLLVVFLLFLSAVSEAILLAVFHCSYRLSWELFVVLLAVLEASHCFCQPSRKLLSVFIGRLGSFSLPFLLFCSRPFSCCFSQLLLFFWQFLSLF